MYQLLRSLGQGDHLNLGGQGQPEQHSETLVQKKNRVDSLYIFKDSLCVKTLQRQWAEAWGGTQERNLAVTQAGPVWQNREEPRRSLGFPVSHSPAELLTW